MRPNESLQMSLDVTAGMPLYCGTYDTKHYGLLLLVTDVVGGLARMWDLEVDPITL